MDYIRIYLLLIATVCVCIGLSMAEPYDEDEKPMNSNLDRFEDWMKRGGGCAKLGGDCGKGGCCPGGYCNSFSGRCDRCAARRGNCGYFKPCCPGTHCVYKGRISVCE